MPAQLNLLENAKAVESPLAPPTTEIEVERVEPDIEPKIEREVLGEHGIIASAPPPRLVPTRREGVMVIPRQYAIIPRQYAITVTVDGDSVFIREEGIFSEEDQVIEIQRQNLVPLIAVLTEIEERGRIQTTD
jgi:hypothetical protein